MRWCLPLLILVAVLLWLSHWRTQVDAAWSLCASLMRADPQTISLSGSLTKHGEQSAALRDPLLSDGTPFAGTVLLSLALAGRPESGQDGLVSGRFRCLAPLRNPSRVTDGLGAFEGPRLFLPKDEGEWVPVAGTRSFASRFAELISWPLFAYPGLRGLVRAVWLGDTEALPPSLVTFYREGGLLPILALSGQHVVVLTALLLFFLRRGFAQLLRWRIGYALAVPYRETLRALPFLTAYLLYVVSDRSPSMLRTAAMAGALFALRLRRLDCAPLQLATSAVACAIVASPTAVARPGFLLSAACTAFLLRLAAEDGVRGLWRGLLMIGPAMCALALPLSAFFFGHAAWAAPLLQLLLDGLWELVLMPFAFLLPFVAPLFGRYLDGFENGWNGFVTLHERLAPWVAKGYRPVPVPTWLELAITEACLLLFFVRLARCVTVRRALHFLPGGRE